MADLAEQIADNLADVRQRIARAAARAGRKADEVRLVAVTKYTGPDEIRALVAAGCTELGEARPQQLWQRAAELADLPIRWHMIGRLQRNKVRRTLPLVSCIHSVASPRLAAEIDHFAGELGRPAPILVEVNISGEASKDGLPPEEVGPMLEEAARYENVEIRGLMCMAGLEGGLDAARREFAALRILRDRLMARGLERVSLAELSMGMSGDFEAAIEEGATMVRIGSALFEQLAS